MKARAFILINCKPGTAQKLCEKIQQVPGVQYAEVVTGPYDIIALVQDSDLNYIGAVVVGRIHTLEGVEKTLTCSVVRFNQIDTLIY